MPTNTSFESIETASLATVIGGIDAGQWNQIKQEAAPYCPDTVQKYGSLNPAKITRGKAQQIGNACLAEMGPLDAGFARSKINEAISAGFPAKR